MKERLPPWVQDWLGVIQPVLGVALIIVIALILRYCASRLMRWMTTRYGIPAEVAMGTRRVLVFLIWFAALIAILERLGVSGTVLWTALTGFAAVAAVAFFAAWSVLSNIFCTLLIVITRPFRLYDYIEVLENGEKPGLKGRVTDINFIYTTLAELESEGQQSVLEVPNNLFFQRTIRRWRGNQMPKKWLAVHSGETGTGGGSPAAAGGGGTGAAAND